MISKRAFLRAFFATLLVMTCTVEAAQDIKVLLFRGSGVSSTNTLSVLSQINDTLDASQMGSYRVSSARMVAGAPFVDNVLCTGSNSIALVECIAFELKTKRNTYAADVVVLVVNSLDQCGSTRPLTINRPSINPLNEPYAFVVIKEDCLIAPDNGMRVASHELGHILSLEHSDDANSAAELIPIPFNHAAEDFDDLTVMGNEAIIAGDCPVTSCAINDFYSELGRTFPDGGSAGDATYSNSKLVLTSQSWDTVANYRPIVTVVNCTIVISQCFEEGGPFDIMTLVTPQLSGYTVANQKLWKGPPGAGPVQQVYDSILNCLGGPIYTATQYYALLTTIQGYQSSCDIVVQRSDCDNPWE